MNADREQQGQGLVWVVDDNAAVAESTVLLLATQGVPAVALFGATETVDRLQHGDVPRLMVLDLKMPGGGGGKVLDYLLAGTQQPALPDFPVIVMTGAVEHLSPEQAARVACVLLKPADPADLLREVKACLERAKET